MRKILIIIWLMALTTLFANAQDRVSISTQPKIIYAERGENKHYLNFDFLLKNTTADTLTIVKIEATVAGKNGHALHQRFLDNNGISPSIQTIPDRVMAPGQTKLIFNPFADFNAGLPINQINYQFTLINSRYKEIDINTTIHPVIFIQKIPYLFPLKGKALVYDAHDYLSHHRRFDYMFEPIRQLGITSNFMRYAYDFVLLDSANKKYPGDSNKDEQYFGYGKNVYAIAGGRVLYASNKHKDDKTFDIPGIANNPLELYGNCIALQHSDSSISIYGHLKQNSLKIKVGDFVKAGQQIASIGVSGSSFFPHLHFEVRTSLTHSAEGLPSYFSNVYSMDGIQPAKLNSGLVETGSIIIAK